MVLVFVKINIPCYIPGIPDTKSVIFTLKKKKKKKKKSKNMLKIENREDQ